VCIKTDLLKGTCLVVQLQIVFVEHTHTYPPHLYPHAPYLKHRVSIIRCKYKKTKHPQEIWKKAGGLYLPDGFDEFTATFGRHIGKCYQLSNATTSFKAREHRDRDPVYQQCSKRRRLWRSEVQ
jgi:hypothetical protein